MNSIKISDQDKEDLREFYRLKLKQGLELVERAKTMLSQLDKDSEPKEIPFTQVEQTTIHGRPKEMVDNALLTMTRTRFPYKKNMSWSMKARTVLLEAGRCLTTREIIDRIKEHEPMESDPVNSVSSTLSTKVSKGIIFQRYLPFEGSDNYFGLKEWFDEEGKPKEGFEAL